MSILSAVDSFNNGLSYTRLIELFEEQFLPSFDTRLEAGHSEPMYIPAAKNTPARICFRADYASSALHEVAHWCIAGKTRRQAVDYGYWYAPDGRSLRQQAEFEKVEVKPQAMEWLFSLAAGISFNISADNLDAGLASSQFFAEAVARQALKYLETGLPDRAQLYYQTLLEQGQGKEAERGDFLPRLGLKAAEAR